MAIRKQKQPMKILYVLASLLLLALSGCTTGLLFSHTVSPLDLNQEQTQIGPTGKEGNIKNVYFITSAAWDSNAIGDIAKKNGIEIIYYADIEKLVIFKFLQLIYLGPVWSQYTVHVYGKERTTNTHE